MSLVFVYINFNLACERLGITANAARKRFNRLKARLDEMREYEEGGRENDTNDDATMEDDNANIEADPKQTAD